MSTSYCIEKYIQYKINREVMKVQANAQHQNSLPGQDLTLKIVQTFFDNFCG